MSPPAAAGPEAPAFMKTILFVEDEPLILALGRRQLERLGYTVLAAGTAEDAARQADAHGRPLDLLVTDVTLPGMDGRALAARLAGRQPGLKCLFLSGHGADILAEPGVPLEAGQAFLQKPFTGRALAEHVRTLLEVNK